MPSIAGEMLARTIGCSGLVAWDLGVPDTTTNVPSSGDSKLDPHPKVRTLATSNTQTDVFIRTGKIDMTACGGGPCKGS